MLYAEYFFAIWVCIGSITLFLNNVFCIFLAAFYDFDYDNKGFPPAFLLVLLVVGFQNRKILDPEYDDTSESKRKKSYSRREILEKLEECENDVKMAVGEIVAGPK